MESTWKVAGLSSCDEPDDINNANFPSFECTDQWPIDTGSCDGDNIIMDFLNRLEADAVEPKQVGTDDGCMISKVEPNKPVEVIIDDENKSDELHIVEEKGKCHCFVCDSPAPCKFWHNSVSLAGHCHASDKIETCTNEQKELTNVYNPSFQVHSVSNPFNVTDSNAFSELTNQYEQQVLNTQYTFSTSHLNMYSPYNNSQLDRSHIANMAYGTAQNIQTQALNSKASLDMNYYNRTWSNVKKDFELILEQPNCNTRFKRPGTPAYVSSSTSMFRGLQSSSNPTPNVGYNTRDATVEDTKKFWRKLLEIAEELGV